MAVAEARRPDLDAVRRFVDALLARPEAGSEVWKREALNALSYGNAAKMWLERALRAAREAVEEAARGYREAGYLAARLYYRLTTPGLVGAGGGLLKPVFEVGLAIHPLLGLPYYPGSGVKGAVRALAEHLLGEAAASALFGSAGDSGAASAVVFEDALPVGCSREPCSVYRGLVLTPHYSRGGEPVPNELFAIPQPVPHMGIEEGLVYAFVYAVHPVRAARALQALGETASRGVCGAVKGYEPVCGAIRNALERDAGPEEKVAAVVFVLLNAALGSGIASRSTKGYNVFEPHRGDLKFSIVGYSYEPPMREERGAGRRAEQRRPGPQRRHGPGRRPRRQQGRPRRP